MNANGTRDAAFGVNGLVTTALDSVNFIYNTILQPDGKLVAVGPVGTDYSAEYDIGLVRYLPDAPAPPPFFDFDGDNRADV